MDDGIVCAKEEDIQPGKILWWVHPEWAFGVGKPENLLVIGTKIVALSKVYSGTWGDPHYEGIAAQYFKTDCAGERLFSIHTPEKAGILHQDTYDYMLKFQACNGIFLTKDMAERYIQSVEEWKHLTKSDKPVNENEVNLLWYKFQGEKDGTSTSSSD